MRIIQDKQAQRLMAKIDTYTKEPAFAWEYLELIDEINTKLLDVADDSPALYTIPEEFTRFDGTVTINLDEYLTTIKD